MILQSNSVLYGSQFPGPIAGEPEVAHLLCSVHSNRTLLRQLGSNANKPEYINSSNMRCTVIQG